MEILKKEKEVLEKQVKEKDATLNYNNHWNKSYKSNKSRPNSVYNIIIINSKKTTNLNTLYNSTQKQNEFEEIKNYEHEVLEKIQRENMFSEVDYQKEDFLGDFIDRVIEGSLYIYRNR